MEGSQRATPPERLATLRQSTVEREARTAELGPITVDEFREWARQAHELVVEHLVGGWPGLEGAFRYANALDATADLAAVFAWGPPPAPPIPMFEEAAGRVRESTR